MPPSNDDMGALQRSRHNRLKLALIPQFHSEDFDFCCDGCAAVTISEITSGVLTSLCHVPFYCLIHVKKSALLFLCWTAPPAKLTSEALTFCSFTLDVCFCFFVPSSCQWNRPDEVRQPQPTEVKKTSWKSASAKTRSSIPGFPWTEAGDCRPPGTSWWEIPSGGLCEMQGWRKTVGFKWLHPLLHRNDGSASSGYLPTVPINWICTENTFP